MGLEALPVKFPGKGATLAGYLARPNGSGAYPAIMIHADRGLDESTRRRARRYAADGFVALAVDPLSRQGGSASFASSDAARRAIATLTEAQFQADLHAAFAYLQSNPSVRRDRIGLTRWY